MGAAAALTADGFINIKFHLKEAFLDRGTWLMNRTTVLAALLLKDGQGNYIWSPGILGQGDVRGNIVGLPIRMSTTMPAVSANALAVALADWKAAYLILDRLGITVQRDPYTVKPFVEFYTRKRVGGDVDNWEAIKIGVIHV
jgi:HK97 family phage major capsid protein